MRQRFLPGHRHLIAMQNDLREARVDDVSEVGLACVSIFQLRPTLGSVTIETNL